MRDHLLFGVLPYLLGLAFVAGSVVQLAVRQRVDRNELPAANRGAFWIAWRVALAAVAIGHVLTLALPEAVLRWDREFVRLLLLEGTQIVVGGLAVAGAIVGLAQLLRPAQSGRRSSVDVVAATLLLTTTVSGLGVAILYRWASAWSAVTLAPYVSSLARFDPSTELIAHLPVLVKLHVVSALAIVAILPFTGPARAIVTRLTLRGHRHAAARHAQG
jgi:nitrate reductase gamma subunit